MRPQRHRFHIPARLVGVFGWIVVALWIGVLCLEGAGVLHGTVQSYLRVRLGSLGDELTIGGSEWSIVHKSLSFTDVRWGEDMHVERVTVSLDLTRPWSPRLSRVVVDSGSVRVSESLREAWLEQSEVTASHDDAIELPTVYVRDLEVGLYSRRVGEIPIGFLDARLDSHASRPSRVRGLLRLIGAEDKQIGQVFLGGETTAGDQLEVFASGRDLPLDLDQLRDVPALEFIEPWHPGGHASVDVRARIDLTGVRAPVVEVGLGVSEGRLALPHIPADRPLRDLDVIAVATYDTSLEVWDPAAWRGRAQVRADFEGQGLESSLRWGRAAQVGHVIDGWLSVHQAKINGPLIDLIGRPHVITEELMPMLDARGTVDFHGGVRISDKVHVSALIDDPEAFDPGAIEYGLKVVPTGDASVAYHGRLSQRGQRDIGFPLRVEEINGHVVFSWNREVSRQQKLGLIDLAGTTPTGGEINAHGSWFYTPRHLLGPRAERGRGSFYLHVDSPGIPLDEHLEEGVRGLSGVLPHGRVWGTYTPEYGQGRDGGSLKADFDLWSGTENPAVATRLAARITDGRVRWQHMPILVEDVDADFLVETDGQSSWGSGNHWGLAMDVTGHHAALREPLRLDLFLRQKMSRAQRSDREAVLTTEGELLRLEVRGLNSVHSSLERALVSQHEELAGILEDTGVQGFFDVTVTRERGRPDSESTTYVVATPIADQVRAKPSVFDMRTEHLEGQIFASIRDTPSTPGASPSSQAPRVETRVHPIAGLWGNPLAPVRVGMHGLFRADGSSVTQVFGAGLSVSNPALLAVAARAARSGSGPTTRAELERRERLQRDPLDVPPEPRAADWTRFGTSGHVDVTGEVRIPGNEDMEDFLRSSFSAFLRDGELAPDGRPILWGVHGELTYGDTESPEIGSDGQPVAPRPALRARELNAMLGVTPVQLRDFVLVREGEDLRFEGDLHARRLPLDSVHLAPFLDPAVLRALTQDLGWHSVVDAVGLHMTILQRADGETVTRFHGPLTLSDTGIDVGIPVSFSAAHVDEIDLRVEGGKIRFWAQLSDTFGEIAGRRIDRAEMLVSYVAPRLSIRDLRGEFEGGVLRSIGLEDRGSAEFFSLDLAPPFRFQLAADMRGVDAGELLRGAFNSDFANQGDLRATMRLDGDLERLTDIRGDGEVRLGNSSLWAIPVFQSLFSQLGFDTTATFHRMETRFALRDGRFDMSGMRLKSDLLSLVGEGWVDLDGRMHHDLQVRYSLVDRLGPLTWLLYQIQNGLLAVSIRGDMARPQVILRGLLSALVGVQGGEDQALPLPKASSLPVRF